VSIDVKDFRKFREGKLTEEALKAEPRRLLDQVESEAANTGDAHLDKMIRGMQALIEKYDAHAQAVATKGIGCVQDDMLKLQQFEFFYTKGQSDALKGALLLPEQIIAESKGAIPSGTVVN